MFARIVRLSILMPLVAVALSPNAQGQDQPYRFSPVNQWDINKTASYWNPIVHHVATRSGVPLQ
ncbi:MAG: ABC transporter substrate-binding protein, partial [Phycisphaerae bacterium]